MMIKYLLSIISFYYFVIPTAEGWRPFRIEVTNVSTASYVNFTQMNSSISTNGALSMYINILQDISDVYAKIEILIASSSGNYDLELVNKTIHVCEFFRNRRYEPIVQLFYKAMTKTGSFPHSCPIRKKLYFVKDVLVDTEDFPPVFPSQKGFGNITILSKNGNKLSPLYGFVIHAGSIQLN